MLTLPHLTENIAKGRPERPKSSRFLLISLYASLSAIITGSAAILNIVQQGEIARMIQDIGICSLSVIVIFICRRTMKRRQAEYAARLNAYEASIRAIDFDLIGDGR